MGMIDTVEELKGIKVLDEVEALKVVEVAPQTGVLKERNSGVS